MKLLLNDKASLYAGAAAIFLCCLCLLPALPAKAQTITTTTPLSFGTIAIRDLNLVGRVTILSGGSYTYNSNVFIHVPPTRGEYRIEGGPANTMYTVTVPVSVSLPGPGGPFTLDLISVEPAVLITDAAGEDTFYVIGRLQTLGGGTGYGDGPYNSTFLITVNF
jgi:hypothetical protein